MNRLEADELIEAVLAQIKLESLKKEDNVNMGAGSTLDEGGQHFISQQAYAVLASVFPTVLTAALEILDHGKVTRFVTQESRREFYRVKEAKKSSGANNDAGANAVYRDIVGEFCFCFFYAKQCLSDSGASMLCKHVLAAKLASALGEAHPDKLTVKEIEEQDYAPLVLSQKMHLTKFDEKKIT